MTARRVGLTPTPSSTSSASGWAAPATSQKAAAEMSPGTASSSGRTTWPPAIDTRWAPSLPPPPTASDATSTPRARSIRSVWSRVAVASVTDVTPSAARPASRMADFTWALGTAVVQSIDRRGR